MGKKIIQLVIGLLLSASVACAQPSPMPFIEYAHKIIDADGNTYVDVEETSNEDVIHLDVAGGEVLTINAGEVLVNHPYSLRVNSNSLVAFLVQDNASNDIFYVDTGSPTVVVNATLSLNGVLTCTDCVDYTDIANLNSMTATRGNILVADSTAFNSVALSGDVTITDGGVTDISFINSQTATEGNLLIGQGDNFSSIATNGDVTISSGGTLTIGSAKVVNGMLAASAVTSGKISNGTIQAVDMQDINSMTTTSGFLMIADGNAYNAKALGGNVSLIGDGTTTVSGIQKGMNVTVTTEGNLAYDTNDENIRVYDGANNRAINTVYKFQVNIYDPDSIQPVEDAVPVLAVEPGWAPFGITLINVGIKTDASSTYAVNFEEWTSPTDGSPSTIENVSTSSSTEAQDDGTLTDASIASGSIIYADLPTTGIDMLQVWGTYYINTGN